MHVTVYSGMESTIIVFKQKGRQSQHWPMLISTNYSEQPLPVTKHAQNLSWKMAFHSKHLQSSG